jgi:hypothetical protein
MGAGARLVGCGVVPLLVILTGCHLLLPLDRGQREDAQAIVPGDPCCGFCVGYQGAGRIIWPIDAEVADSSTSCTSGAGPQCPVTGRCSAIFFRYGSCETWKVYELPPSTSKLTLRACSDHGCCDACTIDQVLFEIQEPAGDGWVTKATHSRPELTCSCAEFSYQSSANKVRIVSTGAHGFYLCVFVEG